MKLKLQLAYVTALLALFAISALAAGAQNRYYHQDINSTAGRMLRQEIMNRAIRKQAAGKSRHTSHKRTKAKGTSRRASAHK